MTHEAATSYSDAGATWTDTLDGNGSATVSGTVNVTAFPATIRVDLFEDRRGGERGNPGCPHGDGDRIRPKPVDHLDRGSSAVTHEAATSYYRRWGNLD